ncbi:MAG: FAD-binding protein [Chloroflexi bacterium]|nr:FAD-binding protein [Chloroflexota bacterium]
MPQIECDVVVIGGGLAGCWAAIRARDKAQRVILVEKGKVSRSGKSSFAGAGVLCPFPTDDLDAWRREIVVRGEYLGDQDVVDALLEEQPDRIREMGEWGLNYERDEKGDLVRVSGLGGVTTRAVTLSSQEMMEVLRRRMENIGVQVMDRVFVTGLLTSDGIYPTRGQVNGCYGFDTRTGEPCVISAASTIVTAGGLGYYYFHGDGIALGFNAGAEVWGMEFTRTMDKMTLEEKFTEIHLLTFQRLGMRLFNRLGERYMKRYYPDQGENATRQQVGIATIIEYLEGRGPVHADLTHLDADSLHKLRTLPSTAPWVSAIEREGYDFGKDRLLFNVHSGFLNAESGGIKHNLRGETSLPGLYVAGEAGGCPVNGTGSVPIKLANCCVEGYRAGEYAASYALKMGTRPVNEEQLRFLEEDTFKPVKAKKGTVPEELMDRVYEYLRPARVSILRTEASCTAILREQQRWGEEANALRARDWHELVKAHQKRSYITCVGLTFKSSLERHETRGYYLRADYPFTDNANWLKHVVLKPESDGIRIRHEPLPMDRYKVKPDRFEKVPPTIRLPEHLISEAKPQGSR